MTGDIFISSFVLFLIFVLLCSFFICAFWNVCIYFYMFFVFVELLARRLAIHSAMSYRRKGATPHPKTLACVFSFGGLAQQVNGERCSLLLWRFSHLGVVFPHRDIRGFTLLGSPVLSHEQNGQAWTCHTCVLIVDRHLCPVFSRFFASSTTLSTNFNSLGYINGLTSFGCGFRVDFDTYLPNRNHVRWPGHCRNLRRTIAHNLRQHFRRTSHPSRWLDRRLSIPWIRGVFFVIVGYCWWLACSAALLVYHFQMLRPVFAG